MASSHGPAVLVVKIVKYVNTALSAHARHLAAPCHTPSSNSEVTKEIIHRRRGSLRDSGPVSTLYTLRSTLSKCSEFRSWLGLGATYFDYHPSVSLSAATWHAYNKMNPWMMAQNFPPYSMVSHASSGEIVVWRHWHSSSVRVALSRRVPRPLEQGTGEEHPLRASFSNLSLCKAQAPVLFSRAHWCQPG